MSFIKTRTYYTFAKVNDFFKIANVTGIWCAFQIEPYYLTELRI
jgi:hypothetical protein